MSGASASPPQEPLGIAPSADPLAASTTVSSAAAAAAAAATTTTTTTPLDSLFGLVAVPSPHISRDQSTSSHPCPRDAASWIADGPDSISIAMMRGGVEGLRRSDSATDVAPANDSCDTATAATTCSSGNKDFGGASNGRRGKQRDLRDFSVTHVGGSGSRSSRNATSVSSWSGGARGRRSESDDSGSPIAPASSSPRAPLLDFSIASNPDRSSEPSPLGHHLPGTCGSARRDTLPATCDTGVVPQGAASDDMSNSAHALEGHRQHRRLTDLSDAAESTTDPLGGGSRGAARAAGSGVGILDMTPPAHRSDARRLQRPVGDSNDDDDADEDERTSTVTLNETQEMFCSFNSDAAHSVSTQ